MNRWVMLIRGINVGARTHLPMASLSEILTTLGARQVSTYVQSGNAVFTGVLDARGFAQLVEEEILIHHEFRPSVLVLEGEDFEAAVAGYPFAEAWGEPKTGHIWFFDDPPRTDRAPYEKLAAESERFDFGPGAFYLHAPEGIGRSKLAAKLETLLGLPATARNLNTVAALGEMLGKLKEV